MCAGSGQEHPALLSFEASSEGGPSSTKADQTEIAHCTLASRGKWKPTNLLKRGG